MNGQMDIVIKNVPRKLISDYYCNQRLNKYVYCAWNIKSIYKFIAMGSAPKVNHYDKREHTARLFCNCN